MLRAARICVRLPALLTSTCALLLAYALVPRSAAPVRRRIQIVWCRVVCRLTGLRVGLVGTPNAAGVTVFCANHVSYLDIAVVSRHLEGVFVAKSEVGTWPLFGTIARITGTILVDRRPAQARAQLREIRDHLALGHNLILFPEGTSTDGSGVAPFKSSLLDIASPRRVAAPGLNIQVQPVSIAYVRDLDGVPLTGDRRGLYCWFGDMTLAPHLLQVLGLPGAEVEVRLHPPVAAADVANRKALARYCQHAVAEGVAAAHAGRANECREDAAAE